MSKNQKTDLLFALYITAIICSELLGSKIFTLFSLNASVAIFVYPLTFAMNDIITEVHGKERAKSFVRSGFYVLLFLLGFTLLAIYLPPSNRFESSNDAYGAIFAKSQRIILASLTAFWLSERFDVYVFSKLRQKLGKHRFWFRTNVSNFLSQFIDTVIFMLLAFYIPGSELFIISLIVPYWLLKCAMSVFQTPISYMVIRWLTKGEI